MKTKKRTKPVKRAKPAITYKRATNLSNGSNGICEEDGVYAPKGYLSHIRFFVKDEPFPEYPVGSSNYQWIRVG